METKELRLSEIVGGHYNRFWNFQGRYAVVKGSRGSKKSKTAALWIIWHLLKYPQSNALAVRRYFGTLKESCYNELKWAIHRLGVEADFEFKVSPLEIVRVSTDQHIYFRGFDDAQKLTSIAVAQGYLNYIWIEEAYQIESEEEFERLDLSIRNNLPPGYVERFILTFNPWSEKTWLKSRFFDRKDPDVLAITTTYQMNEWASPAFIKQLEKLKETSPRRYRISGLGEWGIAEGLIYERTERREFNFRDALLLPGAKAFYGLDFGFTDPTAFVCGVLCPEDKVIFIFDEWYGTGATNEQAARAIKAIGITRERIMCDAAEPKSIAELKRLGLNAVPSVKGSDSVRYGIQLIQGFRIIVHPRCAEFWSEITNYAWAKDRQGMLTDRPDHEFSHGMDAMRYAVTEYLRRPVMKFNAQE